MLVSPHLYSHLTTIEDECQVVIIDHVTHIKKKQSKIGDEMSVDSPEAESPLKDDISETSRKEQEQSSPDKDNESTDAEEDTPGGCFIGFRALDELWNMVKSYMQWLSICEDTIKMFKFIVPKALARSPVINLSTVN